jgi:hypothetical protein
MCVQAPPLNDGLIEACGADAAEAAKAIAISQPRPGHSVLGHGTFKAAETAWVSLVELYKL